MDFFSQWHLVVCYHHSVTDPNLKPILPLSPPGWRGIVVKVRAAWRAAARLAEPIYL